MSRAITLEINNYIASLFSRSLPFAYRDEEPDIQETRILPLVEIRHAPYRSIGDA